MTKLLVLGPNYRGRINVKAAYEGFYRLDYPSDVHNVNPDSSNKVFEEILHHSDLMAPDGQYIADVKLAERAAKIYTECTMGAEVYSVYEITYPFEPPKVKTTLLGYDVGYDGSSSLIADVFASDIDLNPWLITLKDGYKRQTEWIITVARS